jgi:hypothetical protein
MLLNKNKVQYKLAVLSDLSQPQYIYRPFCLVTTTIVDLLLFSLSAEGKRINGSLI